MEEKQVKVGEKTFVVHELLAIEFDEIQKLEDRTDRGVTIIKKSANLTDEDYSKLTLRERIAIDKTLGELNGWNEKDFQKSETEEKSE